ncbi:TIGR04141 family sporadically distributed protein [Xanthomonas campestris pv. campestris]|uniref:TIGR04141 family sporadically distributed protein n=1 Tax=Xanthomonas campestris TaxID=339 RepID=UPI002AD4ABAB|nr:TIGR04141 family sporadically distributed protein [Xanthomonas campestris]MEA0735879.1 TIGR04141 family sporadically distributed protein [Xanthomonas campestris pv. campestris]
MPSKEPKSKIGLNIFLLKYNLESATKIWEKREYLTQSSGSGEDDGVAKHRELPFESGGVAGTLLIKHPPSENTPDWVYFINDGLDNETTDQLKNKSVSALLVLKIKDRQFVLAFGHGRHMLEHSCIDTRFGVKVCLNSIEPGRIASIDKQTFDANPRLTRTQATKISSISAYGVNPDQDLLKAVVGITQKAYSGDLGDVVAGMDSLQISVSADMASVERAIITALSRAESSDYLKKIDGKESQFAWVNNLTHETDDAKLRELNDDLWFNFRSLNFYKMWLAAPEIIDWSNLSGFSYWPITEETIFSQFIEISDFRKTFNKNSSLSTLRSRKIYYQRSSDKSYGSYPAFSCVYWETRLGNDNYILHQGNWYKINPDFAKATDDAYKKIPEKVPSSAFPEYDHADEGDYNLAVSSQTRLAYTLLDKKLIRFGGGPSSIEVCDLLRHATSASRGELIHVKRGRESASLSHLFNQGLVSCTLLASAPEFVKEVNEQLRSRKRRQVPIKFPCSDYDLVYAIIDGPSTSPPSDIPFFSKISLLSSIRTLTAYGFNAYLMRIHESASFLAKKAAKKKAKKAAKTAKNKTAVN